MAIQWPWRIVSIKEMENGESGQGNKGAVPCWGCMDSALLSTTDPCSTPGTQSSAASQSRLSPTP